MNQLKESIIEKAIRLEKEDIKARFLNNLDKVMGYVNSICCCKCKEIHVNWDYVFCVAFFNAFHNSEIKNYDIEQGIYIRSFEKEERMFMHFVHKNLLVLKYFSDSGMDLFVQKLEEDKNYGCLYFELDGKRFNFLVRNFEVFQEYNRDSFIAVAYKMIDGYRGSISY